MALVPKDPDAIDRLIAQVRESQRRLGDCAGGPSTVEDPAVADPEGNFDPGEWDPGADPTPPNTDPLCGPVQAIIPAGIGITRRSGTKVYPEGLWPPYGVQKTTSLIGKGFAATGDGSAPDYAPDTVVLQVRVRTRVKGALADGIDSALFSLPPGWWPVSEETRDCPTDVAGVTVACKITVAGHVIVTGPLHHPDVAGDGPAIRAIDLRNWSFTGGEGTYPGSPSDDPTLAGDGRQWHDCRSGADNAADDPDDPIVPYPTGDPSGGATSATVTQLDLPTVWGAAASISVIAAGPLRFLRSAGLSPAATAGPTSLWEAAGLIGGTSALDTDGYELGNPDLGLPPGTPFSRASIAYIPDAIRAAFEPWASATILTASSGSDACTLTVFEMPSGRLAVVMILNSATDNWTPGDISIDPVLAGVEIIEGAPSVVAAERWTQYRYIDGGTIAYDANWLPDAIDTFSVTRFGRRSEFGAAANHITFEAPYARASAITFPAVDETVTQTVLGTGAAIPVPAVAVDPNGDAVAYALPGDTALTPSLEVGLLNDVPSPGSFDRPVTLLASGTLTLEPAENFAPPGLVVGTGPGEYTPSGGLSETFTAEWDA